jgi:transposase-like protein
MPRNAKLIPEDVKEIRRAIVEDGTAVTTLAHKHGVWHATIRAAAIGKTHANVQAKYSGTEVQLAIRRNYPANLNPDKLSSQDVIDIRTLLAAGVKAAELARRYGVSDQTISNIKHGVTWKRLPAEPDEGDDRAAAIEEMKRQVIELQQRLQKLTKAD